MPMGNHFFQSFRDAYKYNSDIQAAPFCILWPSPRCQWKTVNPYLQKELPELLVLGTYCPDKRTGPAIWPHQRLKGPSKEKPVPLR